jgi:outer membrane protein OmpA-like peptidoglycan-associated protein
MYVATGLGEERRGPSRAGKSSNMLLPRNPRLGERWHLSGPAPSYRTPIDKGGQPVDDSHGHHLLTILAGPSRWQTFLTQAMANRATTVPRNFFRVVTSVSSQVPGNLQRLFARGSGGRMVGGTIDRLTRTIYMVPAPGLRRETRLEYALHEGVHLFADPQAPTAAACPAPCIGTFQRGYGPGFGEGLTQVITEDIMDAQGISRYYRDRPYDVYTTPVREIVRIFGLDRMARAYFFGDVASLTTAMEARWGNRWQQVAGLTTTQNPKQALAEIKRLEDAYAARLRQMIQQGPKGDFPTPSRTRMFAGFGFTPTPRRLSPQPRLPRLSFLTIDAFDVRKFTIKPEMRPVLARFVDHVKMSWQSAGTAIGVVRLKGHTDSTGPEAFNRGLGDRRAEAVKQQILALLGPFTNRVLVEIEASPGKAQPRADNRTAAGRSANRRVEIFIERPIAPTSDWPGGKGKAIKWPPDIPDPDKGEVWDQFRFKRGIPEDALGGRSIQEFLTDLCAPVFGNSCKDLIDKAVDKGCEGIAALIEQFGARATGAQKKEVIQRCREAVGTRVR